MSASPAAGRPYVFLSYASTERERALAVADALESAGVPVWVDRTSIHGGASWGKEIVEGIRNCSALLIACTTAAMHSRNIRQEIQLGWRFEKPCLPLLLDAIEFPADVLYFLEGYQWVELLDRPRNDWLPVLLKALNRFGVSTGEPHSRGAMLAPAAAQPPNTTAPGHDAHREPSSGAATRDAGGPSPSALTGAQPPGTATGAQRSHADTVIPGASIPWRSTPPSANIAPLHEGEAREGALPAIMPFVGRGHELEAARRALGEVLAGRGRLLMLAGEPGIGKTRLAQQVADAARERGAQVLWGRCWEGDGAPAYFPWAEVVRGYLRIVESGTAAAELSAGAAELAQVVPDLHAFLPDIPSLPPLDPKQARFRLFGAMSG